MRRRFPRASSRLRKKRCARLLRPHGAIARAPRRKQCQIRCRGRPVSAARGHSNLPLRRSKSCAEFYRALWPERHPVCDKRIRWRPGYRHSKACPRAPQPHREPHLRKRFDLFASEKMACTRWDRAGASFHFKHHERAVVGKRSVACETLDFREQQVRDFTRAAFVVCCDEIDQTVRAEKLSIGAVAFRQAVGMKHEHIAGGEREAHLVVRRFHIQTQRETH